MQWRVLSLGLENADSQFQRMMEWVRVLQTAIPYIDDVLIGSTSKTVEEMVPAQNQDVCVVLTAFPGGTISLQPKEIVYGGEVLWVLIDGWYEETIPR